MSFQLRQFVSLNMRFFQEVFVFWKTIHGWKIVIQSRTTIRQFKTYKYKNLVKKVPRKAPFPLLKTNVILKDLL